MSDQPLVLKDGKPFAAFQSSDDAKAAADDLGPSGAVTEVPLYEAGKRPRFTALYVTTVSLWADGSAEANPGVLEHNRILPNEDIDAALYEGDDPVMVVLKGVDILGVSDAAKAIAEEHPDSHATLESLGLSYPEPSDEPAPEEDPSEG